MKNINDISGFLCFQRHASLSSLSQKVTGYPFGSLVPYDLTQDCTPIIYISDLSEHYKNVLANSKASLCIADYFGNHDPQAFPRCTIMGNCQAINKSELEIIVNNYYARFPKSKKFKGSHSFYFMKLIPTELRWIGGFGSMGWTTFADLPVRELDSIAYEGLPIVEHMNIDHQDSLNKLAKIHFPETRSSGWVQMVFITSAGYTLQIRSSNQTFRKEILFPHKLGNVQEVREQILLELKEFN